MFKKLKTNSKGITLIALAITIIVLLILAGVSIAAITSDNGIIKQAQNAKDETEKANMEERIDQVIIEVEGTHRNPTLNDVIDGLIEEGVIGSAQDVNKETGSITTKDPSYVIDGKLDDYLGKIETGEKPEEPEKPDKPENSGITSQDIANAKDKSIYYGAKINGYELPSGTITDVGWKIFYADANNIYIIADNYIEKNNIPNSTMIDGSETYNKPSSYNSYYDREVFFTDILNDYEGSSRITNSKLKALNNDYFNKKGYSSKNDNMKAVAYMLDTNAWNSNFKDVKNKAEYVIGGPTIEMLAKSYSEKNQLDYQARARNEIGYEVSRDGGKNWDLGFMLDIKDNLYVMPLNYAYKMWIASPSTSNANTVMSVDYRGDVEINMENERRVSSSGLFKI